MSAPLLPCIVFSPLSRSLACIVDLGDGYGFPSSHSQWMGYFASFLFLHFTLRHRFITTGFVLLDYARNTLLYSFILSWSVAVAFSRCVP